MASFGPRVALSYGRWGGVVGGGGSRATGPAWVEEWGSVLGGQRPETDLNWADGSGRQRLQVLRVQEVAGVSAQHLQDPDREPVRLAQGVRRGQEGHHCRHRRPLPAAAAAAAAAALAPPPRGRRSSERSPPAVRSGAQRPGCSTTPVRPACCKARGSVWSRLPPGLRMPRPQPASVSTPAASPRLRPSMAPRTPGLGSLRPLAGRERPEKGGSGGRDAVPPGVGRVWTPRPQSPPPWA